MLYFIHFTFCRHRFFFNFELLWVSFLYIHVQKIDLFERQDRKERGGKMISWSFISLFSFQMPAAVTWAGMRQGA